MNINENFLDYFMVYLSRILWQFSFFLIKGSFNNDKEGSEVVNTFFTKKFTRNF